MVSERLEASADCLVDGLRSASSPVGHHAFTPQASASGSCDTSGPVTDLNSAIACRRLKHVVHA